MKTSGSQSNAKHSSTIIISPIIYFLISIGVSLQISGSNWDIVWHGVGNVESFFTPPHSVIYSGVALAIGSILAGIIQALNIQQRKSITNKKDVLSLILLPLSLPLSLKLAAIGCLLQLTAGPFDFWWHSQFGFDGLLSPPHSVLAVGMLMAALGALIGVYYHCRSQNNTNNPISSIFSKISLIVPFGVFLMVAVGVVLMFTLPFSKGQYFDFNPNPLAALVAASIAIPFVIGLVLFVAAKISSFSTNNRIPFILTSIVAVIITIQSTTTITSNSYFAWLFPLYLLNILPAMVADIMILPSLKRKKHEVMLPSSYSSSYSKVANNRNNTAMKWYLIASITVSVFFLTLFFPWTVDVYGGYFKPPNTLRTEEFFVQLLIPVILPAAVPVSIISSLAGGLIGQKLMNSKKVNSIIPS